MAKTVFDVLLDTLREERSSAVDFMAAGRVEDYAHYRELHGLIRGLDRAQAVIAGLAKTYMDQDDD